MTKTARFVSALVLFSALSLALWGLAGPSSQARPADPASTLWVLSASQILEVDAATGAVVGGLGKLDDARALAVDPLRRVAWVATGRGISSFTAQGERIFERALGGPAAGEPTLAVRPSDGSAWLGWGRRLWSFGEAGQLQRTQRLASAVEALALSADGEVLWVATMAGVEALDAVTGARALALELPAGQVRDLAVTAEGSVWVLQSGELAAFGPEGTGRGRRAAPGLEALAAAALGDIWGLSGEELIRRGRRGGRWERLAVEAFAGDSLEGPPEHLAADAGSGGVWVSRDREVRRFDATGVLVDAFRAPAAVRSLVWVSGSSAQVSPAEELPAVDPWAVAEGAAGASGPQLSVVEPSAFLQVQPASLEVILAYGEGAAPLDLGSLAVSLDGVDVSSSCGVEASGAVCTLGSLSEGLHQLEAQLADTAGATTQTARRFHVLVGEGSHEVALPASADSYLRGWLRQRNEGASSYLELRLLGPHRTLVDFELDELAQVAESVEQARLELYVEANAFNWGFGGREVDAHRLLARWSESGVTWSCPEDTNPSNHRADCEAPWSGGAFDPLATSSVQHTSQTSGWVSFDVTADVVAALSGGELHGWLVKKRHEWLLGLVRYTSKEGESSQAPRLVVRFTGGEEEDLEPPELAIEAPAPGALLATATPELMFSYADNASGVDAESLAATANGAPLPLSCDATEASAVCTPAAVLPEGTVSLSASVADLAGNVSAEASVSFTVDTIPPTAVELTQVEVSPAAEGLVSVTGAAGAAEAGSTVRVTNPRTGQSVETGTGADGSFGAQLDGAAGDVLELVAIDGAGNAGVVVTAGVPEAPSDPGLPPDPSTVAPPLDPTVVTDVFTATEFLYTGPDPIQTGVAPGTIEPRRAAVLRGRVLDRVGAPLSGVSLTVLGHPELGETLSRADGVFDLVVNGGGVVTLTYERQGYVSIQRQVAAPWRDFAWAPEVVLVPYDPEGTVITSGAADAQVARGSAETDADGTRQATLVFPAGTTAELELADGSRQALASMTIRATEYTVGPMGPRAMPGPLPATVGYTYAVELSADEAAGAVSVQFSQPVPLYVENFLGFPVGESVPLGYWDRQAAAWIGSPNGRVVEVLGVDAAGRAEVDVEGTGSAADPATLAFLGITDGERERLAQLYSPGTELWRSPIPHLTPWDCNWPYGPPDDAEYPPDDLVDPNDPNAPQDPDEADEPENPDSPADPEDADADRPDKDDEPCEREGSVLEVEDQILGESLGITGSELSLHYRSDRQRGRTAEYRLRTRVTGSSPPASLKRVEIDITIAGQSIRRTFPTEPSQVFSMTWDGEDAYARGLQGRFPATIRKTYVYEAAFRQPGAGDPNWSRLPEGTSLTGRRRLEGGEIFLSRTRSGTVDSLAEEALGTFDARELGLGGWTLSAHHVYDPNSRTLYLGDGSQRRARHLGPVLTRFAGDGEFGFGGDGGPASRAQLARPSGVAAAPDGSVYIADAGNHRIRRVSPDGTLSTFAGTGQACAGEGDPDCDEPGGCNPCPDPPLCGLTDPRVPPAKNLERVSRSMGTPGVCGDGGPATAALLSFPQAVAVAPDGSVLVADTGADCVRRIAPSGIIETVAGMCRNEAEPARGGGSADLGFPDEGFPAIFAELSSPVDVAVAPDGGFYVVDRGHRRVIHVDPAGLLETVAGGGVEPGGDGADARLVDLEDPSGVALGPGGDLFIVESQGHRIRRLSVDGRLHLFAGSRIEGFSGDGGDALEGQLSFPERVVAAPDGAVYFSDSFNSRVRKVDPAGILLTVAGTGLGGTFVSGAPATGVPLGLPLGLALSPEGDLLLADDGGHSVLRMGQALAGFGEDEIVVPSTGGASLYVFDAQGRHLRTRHALTGANLYRFEYGESGLLGAVVDRNEQRTTVQRDASGRPEGITAPSRQQTALVLDPEGYLQTWTNPAGSSQEFLYRLGLLERHEDPRGNASTYRHSTFGRLSEATDRAGGIQTFARFGSPFNPNAGVTALDGAGVSVLYKSFEFRGGTRGQTVNDDSLRIHRRFQEPSGRSTVERADGSRSSSREVPDPRFGMAASRTGGFTAELPGGLSMSATSSTEVALSDPDDPLSLTGMSEAVTVNGNTFTSSYDASSRTYTTASPLGRSSTARFDTLGQLVEQTRAGLVPIRYEVRPDGLLSAVRAGDGAEQRSTVLAYDGQRRLASVTDPLGRSSSFTYDAANRVTTQTLPDGSQVTFTYDASSNLTSLTPPGRAPHTFGFTPLDQVATYQPAGGDPAAAFGVTYTAGKDLETLQRPGGEVVRLGYDSLGRLDSLSHARGVTSLTWDAVAGKVGSVRTPEGETLAYSYQGPIRTASSWSGPVAGSVSRTLTNDLKLGSIFINGSLLASYGYDADGLLTQAGPVTLSRDSGNGRITGTALGAAATSRSFNGFGELTSHTASHGGTPLVTATYQRDALGRVTEAAETLMGSSRTTAYRYDLRGRLTEVERGGVVVEAYGYDANGNRTSFTSPTETISASYDGEDRLTSYGDLSYTYSPAGELASKTQGTATELYAYDAFGNLLSVTKPDGRVLEYVLDGENRRVGKSVAGALVQGFLYADALSPVAELDGSGAVISRFVYASRGNVPDVVLRDGKTYRIVSDPLGSVRLVVDSVTGEVAQQLAYDAFGQVQLDTNPGFQPFGFAGGLYDPQTGLVRFGVRDYDPQVGRWTSKDPLGFAAGDTNLYAYVFNDPVNGVDPSGQILPLLAVGYAAFEIGSTLYDLYDTYDTFTDPCADLWDKGLTAGGVLAGMALPGGAYGKGAKAGRKLAKARKAEEALPRFDPRMLQPNGSGSPFRGVDGRVARAPEDLRGFGPQSDWTAETLDTQGDALRGQLEAQLREQGRAVDSAGTVLEALGSLLGGGL